MEMLKRLLICTVCTERCIYRRTHTYMHILRCNKFQFVETIAVSIGYCRHHPLLVFTLFASFDLFHYHIHRCVLLLLPSWCAHNSWDVLSARTTMHTCQASVLFCNIYMMWCALSLNYFLLILTRMYRSVHSYY